MSLPSEANISSPTNPSQELVYVTSMHMQMFIWVQEMVWFWLVPLKQRLWSSICSRGTRNTKCLFQSWSLVTCWPATTMMIQSVPVLQLWRKRNRRLWKECKWGVKPGCYFADPFAVSYCTTWQFSKLVLHFLVTCRIQCPPIPTFVMPEMRKSHRRPQRLWCKTDKCLQQDTLCIWRCTLILTVAKSVAKLRNCRLIQAGSSASATHINYAFYFAFGTPFWCGLLGVLYSWARDIHLCSKDRLAKEICHRDCRPENLTELFAKVICFCDALYDVIYSNNK